ncbi:MAG: hypothetical protein HETSPECPRED_002067 [Heterodermia speciosa]|uniref:Spindle pole body component n=1 Tax=Heterodermia speciosa TaxID=116794 RepID=A0A8H3EZH5_9LECA|nr:MAG: hypothetical protein HETSPECPRED_002067 [Heterodermia speciosa]
MLQELLLALSGHPSPLLATSIEHTDRGPFKEYLSPAESALLQSLAQELGGRHIKIRDSAFHISSTHPSTVCRAVATSITLTHLTRFQSTILEVEKDILEQNPRLVGAYKIVPLSGVAGAFDGWTRKLEWLLSLVDFIESPGDLRKGGDSATSCTASQILSWIRQSTQTGYPDIEHLSFELLRVAETAWLRQVSAWLLYGRLPIHGAADFFIFKETGSRGGEIKIDNGYSINNRLVPGFVTQATANSILFIGNSLNHTRDRSMSMQEGISHTRSPELSLLPSHLAYLSSLEIPISATSFSSAVSAIRLSFSKNVLQKLLPLSKVLEILRVLKDFFLLERGEFAIALITAADQRLQTRQSRFGDKLPPKANDALKSAIIKEGEVSAILARTWAAMACLQSVDDDDEDEDLELARDLINLSIKVIDPLSPTTGAATEPTFDNLLLPTPTALGLRIPSPLDLFLTSSDVDAYSHIHAYLLSLRRAHLRLSKLFLLSVLRRDHPSPRAPLQESEKNQAGALTRMRGRAARRAKTLRPVWATVHSAAYLLTEMGEYFQGEVVNTLWDSFHTWLDPTGEEKGSRPGTASSADSAPVTFSVSTSSRQRSTQPREPALHDPESLSVAHRTYLSALTHALLLDDARFTKELRALLASIDYFSALMARLNSIFQHLDLESDLGIVDTFTNFKIEEKEVMKELASARAKAAGNVQAVITALRDVDAARAASDSHSVGVQAEEENVFVPQISGGLDRLLLKLEFADLQAASPTGPH